MELAELLEQYKNGRRVRERSYGSTSGRLGTIYGSGLGGAVAWRRGGNRFMLTVRVKWDDGTEDLNFHRGLTPV